MYALRERRVHVTQEDFELAVAKVCHLVSNIIILLVVIKEHCISLNFSLVT